MPVRKGNIDLDQVREKYRTERDKRLREDAADQYVEVKSGQFRHFGMDPNANIDFQRDAMEQDLDCLIVGAGFGGVLAAVELVKQGISDFRLIDKAGGFGGVWYWNRYPGINCDIESYIYLPLLEETGYVPSQKFISGAEIRGYIELLTQKFGFADKGIFQTQVREMVWNADAARWIVTTDRGDTIRARFVINANGQLDAPKLPRLKGLDKFKGHCFHSSRWDYQYTGGSEHDHRMEKLRDKKVAVVGTGCTAIQLIPKVAQYAGHLFVVQRTPAAPAPRNNQPTDLDWFKSQKPGWQKTRSDNFALNTLNVPVNEDLVNDGWTDMARRIRGMSVDASAGEADPNDAEIADLLLMEDIRKRIETTVKDASTAEQLKPWYRRYCKRPTFSDDYLPTFNQDNVTLVDAPLGLTEMTENSIKVGDQEYEVDCVIFASGFEVGTEHNSRTGYNPVGIGGLTLKDKLADSWKSYQAVQISDFPNFLIITLQQSGTSSNFMPTLEGMGRHNGNLVATALKKGIKTIQPTAEAEKRWSDAIDTTRHDMDAFFADCTPGYMNNEGNIEQRSHHNISTGWYPGGVIEFIKVLERWREDGQERDMEIERL